MEQIKERGGGVIRLHGPNVIRFERHALPKAAAADHALGIPDGVPDQEAVDYPSLLQRKVNGVVDFVKPRTTRRMAVTETLKRFHSAESRRKVGVHMYLRRSVPAAPSGTTRRTQHQFLRLDFCRDPTR